ncbi:MAG: EpsG family [Daejeonella sp.]|nr:EpsG family [Daejeonella sp.]
MPFSRDYENYKEIFQTASDAASLQESMVTAEVVFSTLSYVTKSFAATIAILGIISLTIKIQFLNKLSSYAWIAILYYFARYFIVHDITQVRISFGIAMLLVSFIKLMNRNYLMGFLFFFFAIISHSSTLVYVPIIIFASLVKRPEVILRSLVLIGGGITITYILLAGSNILDLIPIDSIISLLPDERLEIYYLETYDFSVPSLVGDVYLYLKIVALVVLALLPRTEVNQSEEIDQIYFRSGIVLLFSIVFFVLLHDVYAIASRMADIAAPFECLVMSLFIIRLSKPKNVIIPRFSSFSIRILLTAILVIRLFVAQLNLL